MSAGGKGSEFPVLGSPRRFKDCPKTVPWCWVESFAAQLQRNHSQTVQRLAERGGLNACELWLASRGLGLFEEPKVSEAVAVEWLETQPWKEQPK